MIPDSIRHWFAPWADIHCWVLCNQDKIPVNRHTGNPLPWKIHPGNHVNTLDAIAEYQKKNRKSGYGFGIILGRENSLGCFDFDHALGPDVVPINPAVSEVLDVMSTFAEISVSGTGLHAFVNLDEHFPEYGFKKEFCDGKFYPERFIKLTGDIFPGYDLPVKSLTRRDCEIIRNKIGVEPVNIPIPANRAAYTGKSRNWSDILTEVGIMHISAPQYVGHNRQHGLSSRVCISAWKIQCPNVSAHSDHHRRGDFSADAAILSQWNDGSSSCTCNHNSCNPAMRPNLLHKLWQQVHRARDLISPPSIKEIR